MAVDDSDGGDEPRTRRFIVVHTVCGKRAEFEKRSVRIEDCLDALPNKHLPTLFVASDSRFAAALLTHVLPDVSNNRLERSARLKDFADSKCLQFWDVLIGDDAADYNQHISEAFLLHELHDAWAKRHMSSGKHGESNDVDIFLQRRVDHLLGSLSESGVDDFETGIAKSAGDHFCTAVMAIESCLGNEHTNLLVH